MRHIQVDSRELAEDLLEKLENGASFSELAKKYSTCPTGNREGNLGWIDPLDTASALGIPLVDSQVEAGKRIGPIDTLFGYHIIEILEIQKSLDQNQTAS